jgi:pimeloyl-ACP methyl ester carboxylesterase
MSKHLSNQLQHHRRRIAAGVIALGLAIGALAGNAIASSPTARTAQAKPTIVLVHGAWANTASWSGVIERLQAEGYTVYAPPNPLRSLTGDAQTIADFLKTIKGPIVLVGHSYGGAVITNAANGIPNVKALVYVDAFAPAKGESAFELTATFPGSVLNSPPPPEVFKSVPFPGAKEGDLLLYVNLAFFMNGFANDLSAKQGAVAEATQAPR